MASNTRKRFSPELKYIKGENNVVSDTLTHLVLSDNKEILRISELYGYNNNDLPDSAYPVRYHNIPKVQEMDDKLRNILSHIKTMPSPPFVGVIKTIV